jgi:hypothetical protein
MPFRNTVARWTTFLVVLAAPCGRTQTTGFQYSVAQTYALRQEDKGARTSLVLLMDIRLSKSLQKDLWGKGDWAFVFPPDSNAYREFSNHPPMKSKLQIINSAGGIVAERDLETPLARLQAWKPTTETSQLFLLTQDYSAGFGSYSGLVTSLIMIADGAFREVQALDTESRRQDPIRLMKSLKSDWRIIERVGRPEILSVSCHPNEQRKFVIDYARYSFDGSQWVIHKRETEGIWESDDPFPESSAFR